MADTDDDHIIGIVASADVVHVITEALVSPDPTLFTPALKALGSILTSDDHEVLDRCLWSGCLLKLNTLVEQMGEMARSSLIREVCWAVSNITAGNC